MMNPHERFGFQYKGLLAGSWEFDNTMSDQDYNNLPAFLTAFVNSLGFALSDRGIVPQRLRILPFPDFSYAVIRADDAILVMLGRGPVQSRRYGLYYDFRQQGRVVTAEAAAAQFADDVMWDHVLTAVFPPSFMSLSSEERDNLIGVETQRIAGQLAESAKAETRKVSLQPISIFPNGLFERDERLCFVLMPFAIEFQEVYDFIIQPVVAGAGLTCWRADDIMESGDILAQIYRSLMQARVVVADLTGTNGNVLYELGLAHMMGHQAILLTQEIHQVPFDLRQQRLIHYSLTPSGVKDAKRKLKGALATLESQ